MAKNLKSINDTTTIMESCHSFPALEIDKCLSSVWYQRLLSQMGVTIN